MLLGKLCERKDKTALMYMHSTVLLFETRKLIYKTTRQYYVDNSPQFVLLFAGNL